MKKLTLFLVAMFAMVNIANAQRAWAYDLELTPSVDSYTFAFKAVTAGDATLVFYKEGVAAGALDLGAVSAGANTVTKTSEELLAAIQQSGDFTWGVKMSAGAIAAGTELKQLNSTLYYNMMGIVADVDPESEHFGKVYMQMSYDGKPTNGTTKQTQGFFIYDPIFNLISTPNVGIKPTLPTGYTFDGTDRLQFHRVAIDPKTGNLAFCYSIANKPGVFSIGRNNLTGEVTNLLAGVTGIENIKRTNALCFDEDGALYIIADVTTVSTTGNIYKIVDGVATKLSLKTPSGKSIWIDEQVGLVSDGIGGLWVAQNRSGITDNSAVFHVNVAKDTVDFVLEKGKTYSDWFTGGNGNNCRGGIAYNVKENVLATHSEDSKVSLFKVTYDEETGVPTITKWIQGATGGKNTDAIAFDYAGDLYTGNSSGEYFRKFEVPTDNNTCTTPAKKSQVITLVSATPEYNVTINVNGNGTVTGANTGKYLEGTELTLTATPAEHHEFTGWTGDVSSTENPLTITVGGDKNITANFAKKQYTLTVLTNDENKGVVTGAGTYDYGTVVTIEAIAQPGYKLLYWSDRSSELSRTITMNKNEALSAYFVKEYAVEPTFTIEKVWENAQVPAATGDGYQAVGWDQKIYMQNKTAGKIQVFSNGTDATVDYATSGTGQQIAVDEAGNLIVFNAYFATSTPNSVLIYKKGAATGTAVSFTLQDPARCDFFSASGDIYSPEGGYVYFYCAGKTVINRLKITNGAATTSDVTTDVVGESVYSSPQNTNYVMVDIFGNLVAHARSNAINAINIFTNETKTFSLKNIKMGTLGGCSFELGGKELWAYHAGATNYSSEWNLYNMTDGKFLSDTILYAVDKTNSANNACNWLNVQVVDEKTAYIYQFCPKKAVALWKVTMKETFTVAASANTAEWGTVAGAGQYLEGTTATLTATPNTGYKFVNWTKGGVVVSTDATYSFPVTENVELVANFEALAQYKINAHADPTTHGYVTGSGDYYEGEEVILKATAKTGYYFTQWNDGNPNNPRTITVTDDAEYIAEFAEAYPRVYAYGLNVVNNGDDTYTFSFKPNTDAISGNLLLYSEDGTTVAKTVAITTPIIANTVNSITLAKTDLPDQSDIPWAIELSGNDIPAFAETFADSELRFARAHAVVDNSPESEYFGRVYVADRRSTKSNSKVYVYNPDFTDLEATNLGLATAGYSRPAVGADGTLYLTGYTDGAEAGIFVVNPADLTKCTQFFNGTYDDAGLYINNGKEIGSSTSGVGVYGAGKDAVLYTMMEDGSNANVNSGKQPIVCYQIGQANGTVLKQWGDEPTWLINYPAKSADKSYNFGNNDFSATANGVWVSQNKSNPDDRPEIAFVDKTGTIQFMQNSKPCLGGGMTVNADNTALYIVEDGKILEYAITWNENKPSLTLSNTYPISLQYISTLSVDYAGNLIACAGTTYGTTDNNVMKVVRFTLPTDDNHIIVPAPKAKSVKLGKRYTVTVVVNDETMGEAIGGGSYKEGETATIAASAKANHRFVKWTKDEETVSNVDSYSFEVTKDVTYTANFEPIPQYTIIADPNDPIMGTVSGSGTYYEGDNVTLTATAKAGYVFVKWSDEETDESRTFTASENVTLQAIFKVATPRAWAYDLKKGEDSDNYTFTFTATSDGNATILFTDKDGYAVAPTQEVVGAVTAGETKTVSIDKDLFTGTKDIYWSVKVDGAPIEKMAEITDPTKGIYDIVAPQGIAVDNNTDSKHFGQVYVAAATDGTVSRGAQTRGIFVYDPILNELNSPNAGFLPANATLTSNTRQAIHRVAVNPTNNQVAFAYNISGSSAIWSMNPENLAGDAVNLIDGAGITKANSLCFDESGALYVMDNANTSTGGNIYKIKDGVANVFAVAQTGYYWGVEENAMTPDGRGGLWIAQNRWQVDLYPALSHVDKNGNVDFAVTSSSPEALKALFPHDDNNASYRGQCAYYAAEDILAFGGNKEAVLFKVTYDANNAPTNLEKLMSTGKIGLNIDGLAFDYAGDLYVASETTHRMYKFVIPTNTNTCTVPAPDSQIIKKEARYTVTVAVNDNAMGTATGGGTDFLYGEEVTVTAVANTNYEFVNWTEDDVEVSTSAEYTFNIEGNRDLVANFQIEPLKIKGIVKRAVQIGESTVVLTHEANGNPHLYKVVDGALVAEISQVGVIARDPDNAGDYLAISDIALTEDGKLVATNKIVCQSEDGQVAAGYKRGELRAYIWNDLAGAPSLWFTSKQSSNWYRSIQGHTIAYKGTSTNGTLFATGVTASGVKFRYSAYNVIDGVHTDPSSNNSDYYHFTKGSAQTTDALGANYQLVASPLASPNWILDGELVDPFEIVDPLTFNTEVTANAPLAADLGKKYNGASVVTVGEQHLMVAPYADGENVAGVTVLDITNGLDQAEEMDYAELTTPLAATAAATAVKVNGDDLTITLVVDNDVYVFNIDLNLQYTRTVTSGDFGTICLPYGSSSYSGAEFYEIAYLELQADGVTPKGIWLDEVTGALEAGKPYIFKATSNLLTVNYKGEEALSPVVGEAGLTGTFDGITDETVLQGNYMIAENKFWLCGTGCWLNANRAYIDKNTLHNNTTPVAAIPGRRRVSMGAAGENTTTGIDNLTEGGAIAPNMEGTYDVLGRKMNEPNNTGFYIVNGKKVVIVK